MTLTAYPHYRASEIPWITKIPTTWTTVPFFTVMRERKRSNEGMVESNLLSLSYGRIVTKDIDALGGLLPESFETYQIVEPDDIVFRLTDLQNDQRSLRTAICEERGIITSAYGAATPTGIEPRYASYLMRAYDTTKVFYGYGGGVRQSLKLSDISRMPVLLPSIMEQRAIARYLDSETAKIDALIVEQEGLVRVLRERRAALAARILVSGLNAEVAMEASSVDWLGALPSHWRTVPTRYLCKITTGSEDSGNAQDDGEYPFFVRGREILRIGHYSFDCEAVMTPGDGQGGTGKVFHYYEGKFEAHQRVYVYKDFKHLLARYYYYYLSTFLRPVALASSNTVTMESLRRPVLADFVVALPPVEEQRQIVTYLDEQTEKIDNLIAEAEGVVTDAKERRAALIVAAATGQVDVETEVA